MSNQTEVEISETVLNYENNDITPSEVNTLEEEAEVNFINVLYIYIYISINYIYI
jgi:hypothetical protein